MFDARRLGTRQQLLRSGRLEVRLRVPSPLTEIIDDRLSGRGVRLYLKRDDLIHPELAGNKWRKLKYNLQQAKRDGYDTLLTFGGAYSNHVRATAAAGQRFGFKTIGVIRGERHRPLNDSLAYAVGCGMTLSYMDRTTYRNKAGYQVLDPLRQRFGDFYLLPEGGSNALAVHGCAELPAEVAVDFDVVCCACGTGATLAGVAAGLATGQRAMGFSALRGGGFLRDDVAKWQRQAFGAPNENWTVELDFHCGGFAKRSTALDTFIEDFGTRHDITLDWVYVAKMLFGLFTMVERGEFAWGTRIVAVITG